MNKNMGVFSKKTGTLFISNIDLLINNRLRREYFLKKYAQYLLYLNKDFFGEYGFFIFLTHLIFKEIYLGCRYIFCRREPTCRPSAQASDCAFLNMKDPKLTLR